MLLKNTFLLALVLLLLAFFACEKFQPYDRDAQLQLDIDSIAKFVLKNKIPAIKDASGLYYQILRKGRAATNVLGDFDTIEVNYTGKLLNDSIVERADSAKLVVSGLPEGIRRGMTLVPLGEQYSLQPGGSIRLIIPSVLAYINRKVYTVRDTTLGIYTGIIPPNSNLDYNILLLNIYKENHNL